jgi:hypothetical protein
LQGHVAVVAQQSAFTEAAAAVEQDDEALQFVVGGGCAGERGVEVGICGEENRPPAPARPLRDLPRPLAADEDAAQVVGVFALIGSGRVIGWIPHVYDFGHLCVFCSD